MFSRKTPQEKAAARQAVGEHKQAKKALHDNQRVEERAGIREESPTYLALNARVNETEQRVPWYRR